MEAPEARDDPAWAAPATTEPPGQGAAAAEGSSATCGARRYRGLTGYGLFPILVIMSFDLATHIRQLREELGWTQEDLAKRAHIDQGDLSRIERGGTDPRWSTVNRIINALGETFSLTSAPTTIRPALTAETRGDRSKDCEVGCSEPSTTRRGGPSHQAVTFLRPALHADREELARFESRVPGAPVRDRRPGVRSRCHELARGSRGR